jgi:PAS domain S-box-containing protein
MKQGLLIAAIILQVGVGTAVVIRSPRARLSRFFACCALSFALRAFADLLRSLAISQTAGANLAVLGTIAVHIWGGTFVGLCVLAIFYGRQVQARLFWFLYVPVGLAVLATIAVLVSYSRLPMQAEVVIAMPGTDLYAINGRAFPAWGWCVGYVAAWALLSLALLVNVVVSRPGRDRQSALTLGLAILLPGLFAVISPQILPGTLGVIGPTLGGTLLLAAFVYVIVRFRLFSAEDVAAALVVDNLSDGMLILRSDQIVLACNARAAEMLGLSRREIVHMRVDHVLAHSPLSVDVWHDLWSRMEPGRGVTAEARYAVGEAEQVVVNQVMPIYDVGKDLQGYVWLIRDVTELRHSQEQIRARNLELQRALEELQDTSQVQGQLLETIRALSAPAVPILEGIIVMPLSGEIDSERAQRILGNLLEGIGDHQAKIAIMDITGVPVVDTAVANHLIRAARAALLMGCRPLLVGIRPEMAQVIVELGIDMSGLVTFSDLQSGVEYALRILGMQLTQMAEA